MISKENIRSGISGQNILVTGGAGFLGSTLADTLLANDVGNLILLDNMFLGDECNIGNAVANGALFIKDDAEDFHVLKRLIKEFNIEIVFNCATKALNYSFINPSGAFKTNVTVILHLLELQRSGDFRTLCHFSTSEVYGSAIYEPMDEIHPKSPTTTYAAGKAAADLAIESWVKMFDLDSFIVRPFNNYGPRQNYKGELSAVIPATVRRILKGQHPILFGDGQQSRDFIYSEDTIDAIIRLFPLLGPGESVNIATNGQVTIDVLIRKICQILDYQDEVDVRPARKADVLCHNASNEKIRGLISFEPTPFDVGLEQTVEWYVDRIKAESK